MNYDTTGLSRDPLAGPEVSEEVRGFAHEIFAWALSRKPPERREELAQLIAARDAERDARWREIIKGDDEPALWNVSYVESLISWAEGIDAAFYKDESISPFLDDPQSLAEALRTCRSFCTRLRELASSTPPTVKPITVRDAFEKAGFRVLPCNKITFYRDAQDRNVWVQGTEEGDGGNWLKFEENHFERSYLYSVQIDLSNLPAADCLDALPDVVRKVVQ